jgi:hypothetical protein
MIQLLLALAPVAASATPSIWQKRAPWATISAGGGMVPPGTGLDRLEIGTLSVVGPPGRPVSYYAYFAPGGASRPRVTKYADSFSCPALRLSVEGLRTVAPSRIEPPGFAPQYSRVMDAGFVSFTSGSLKFAESSDSSELAIWYGMTIEALKACWRNDPPADGALRVH